MFGRVPAHPTAAGRGSAAGRDDEGAWVSVLPIPVRRGIPEPVRRWKLPFGRGLIGKGPAVSVCPSAVTARAHGPMGLAAAGRRADRAPASREWR